MGLCSTGRWSQFPARGLFVHPPPSPTAAPRQIKEKIKEKKKEKTPTMLDNRVTLCVRTSSTSPRTHECPPPQSAIKTSTRVQPLQVWWIVYLTLWLADLDGDALKLFSP